MSAYGVVDRLPPVSAGASDWLGETPVEPVYRLAQSTEAVSNPSLSAPPPAPTVSAPAERGFLQGIDLVADWIPRMEDDGLGQTTLAASVGLGVPPLLFGMPMLVTPRAALHLLDGPSQIDTPSSLNEFDLSFGTLKDLSERWSVRGSFTIGVYGDDDSLGESEALRPSGTAVAIYQPSPEWKWVIGAAYLNRRDISVYPVVGVVHDRGNIRYELITTRPRIVWKLPQDTNGAERSPYLAGELGGGAWAVRRPDGSTDTLTMSRWAALLGYETKAGPGSPLAGTRRYEFGYVFGRSIEYYHSGEDFALDDSLMARVAWSY